MLSKTKIDQLVNTLFNGYVKEPDRLKSDFNRENRTKGEYKGRELLELLQNAEDAAKAIQRKNTKVLIEITDQKLTISNEGEPFSLAGVRSLLYSDNTTKTDQRFIGQMGLGFRSLLNWSQQITVISAGIELQFSHANAVEWLKPHVSHPDIAKVLGNQLEEKWPVATLVGPRCSETKVNSDFTTRIEIGFGGRKNHRQIYKNIQQQLDLLTGQELLFLKCIQEIEIRTPRGFRRIVRSKQQKAVHLEHWKNDELQQTENWTVFSKTGKLPTKYLPKGNTNQEIPKKYQLGLGIPSTLDDSFSLYSFFATEEKPGISLLLHGTFRLSGNRNNILPNDTSNGYLTKQLAHFAVETVCAHCNPQHPWKSLQFLCPGSEMSPTLQKLTFYDQIDTQLRSSAAIFPSLGGIFLTLKEAIWHQALATILIETEQKQLLPQLIVPCEETALVQYVDRLQVEISATDKASIRTALSALPTTTSIHVRARIIAFCLDHKTLFAHNNRQEMPTLLVDQTSNLWNDEDLYIGEVDAQQPNFIERKYLDQKLKEALLAELDISNPKDLAKRLAPFCKCLVATNQQLFDDCIQVLNEETDGKKVTDQFKHVFRWLVMNPNCWPDENDNEVYLPTKHGDFQPATSLFFGTGYPEGSKIEGLLGTDESQLFVCSIRKLGLTKAEKTAAVALLSKLGVRKKLPLTISFIRNAPVDSLYRQDYIEQLKFPAKYMMSTGAQRSEGSDSANELWQNANCTIRYTNTTYLDQILKNASFHLILEWLEENASLLEKDPKGKVEFWLSSGYRSIQDAPKTSYFQHLIATTPWLPVQQNEQPEKMPIALRKCMLVSPKNRAWQHWITLVDLDELGNALKKTTSKKSWKRTDLQKLLLKAGVRDTISDFSQNELVDMLLQAPQTEASHFDCSRLYKHVSDRFSAQGGTIPVDNIWKEFREFGKMLVKPTRNGEINFLPCVDVYYAGGRHFPKNAIEFYPIAQLSKEIPRRNARNLFGLKELPRKEILKYHSSILPDSESLVDHFDNWIKKTKPFIYAYRIDLMEQKGEQEKLENLQQLQIKICKNVRLRLQLPDQSTRTIDLETYGFFKKDGQEYLLVIPEDIEDLNQLLNIDAFVRSIESILNDLWDFTSSEGDTIRLLENNHSKQKEITLNALGQGALDESLRLFQGAKSAVFQFWYAVLKAKEKSTDEFIDSAEKIKSFLTQAFGLPYFNLVTRSHCEDSTTYEALEAFRKLFLALSLKVSEYNTHAEKVISGIPLNKRDLLQIHDLSIEKYRASLHHQLQRVSVEEKRNYFQKVLQIKALESSIKEVRAKEFVNCEKYYNDKILSRLDLGITLTELKAGNFPPIKSDEELLMAFCSKHSLSRETFIQFLEEPQYHSLLYFPDCWDVLLTDYKDSIQVKAPSASKPTMGASPSTNQIAILKKPLFNGTRNPKKGKKKSGSGAGRGSSTRNRVMKANDTGKLGERKVYDFLCRHFKEEDVTWVSEYAREEGINLNGTDRLGYDITYYNEKGTKKYVEVKSSTSSIRQVQITEKELKTAQHDFPHDYEIALVLLKEDQQPEITFLSNVLLDEKYFDAVPSSYRIQFTKEAETKSIHDQLIQNA